MDTEDLSRSDVDTEMKMLSSEDISVENLNASDEVEDLHNSLREAVHDDNVRPKMQCLMMDSSFSMVTMQGEDSGIKWETTPSRCNTPWEVGNPTGDFNSPVAVGPASPVSPPAGKIIFVMDEGLITRQKKAKERTSSQKTKRPQEVFLGSSDNISGRPELISFSQPNVKDEEEENEEEANDPSVDKEQRLFRLVSEGSEILNIVVPPKLVSVDEEVSKEMVDNLSYLEDSPVTKASEEVLDEVFEPEMSPPAPKGEHSPSSGPQGMDPPGAPLSRPPPPRGAAGNVDYFEAFSLIDAQAPGSPAVATQEGVKPETEDNAKIQDTETPGQAKDASTTPPSKLSVESEKADTISLEEITCELLDDVFYGGTNDYMKTSLDRERDRMGLGALTRVPSKPSGSTLFGSQEDILTPIFLPEGPPKIIDPILLEEPKAMAFLYTDLYEEAIGSRKKEEDTESLTSEKSFHSRHSDREARGYLEKYMLIDETPVVEVEQTEKEQISEEGPRTLYQDLNDFPSISKHEKHEMSNSEEEVTDFFRSSANSSPYDVEPFPRPLEEDEAQMAPKTKPKPNKHVSINIEKAVVNPVDPLGDVSLEEPDWGSTDLDDNYDTMYTDQHLWQHDMDMEKPVAPPRKKTPSSPKACLDLTPLMPVDVEEEKEEAGGKEQREEEKETASPPETADEGDGEEITNTSTNIPLLQDTVAAEQTESPQTEDVEEGNEISTRAIIQSVNEEKDNTKADEKTETTTEQTAAEEIDTVLSEPAKTETQEEAVLSSGPLKSKGQCIIL